MNPALQLVAPPAGAIQPGTLDHVVARYLRDCHCRALAGDLHPKSYRRARGYLAKFLAFIYADGDAGTPPVRLGSLSVEQARQTHLSTWLVANYHRWKEGSTRADALGSVLACFNWWADNDDETSPFRRPRKLKLHRRHFRAMRRQHYRAIQRAARAERGSLAFRWALFFAWHTGSRLSEMRDLEWTHIDWELGVVRDLVGKTTRATGKLRIFGLGPRLLAVLRAMYERRPAGQTKVFLSRRGRPWTKDNLGRRFARYRELAGLPEWVKLAGTRHGYAVRLLTADHPVDSKAVADQLGHSTTRMIESVYAAETREDAEQVRRVAALGEKRMRRGAAAPAAPPRKIVTPACPLFDIAEQA